ncbi:MAG: FAD-dependent oxidoreductase [Actinobacteria bacterium]|nr:FAD-dependent oxidoreductase [Actinomycetota bacterium]
MGETYEYLVVGSGAGGAAVARQLALRGKSVLIVERGHPQPCLGTFAAGTRFYDVAPVTNLPPRSREGVTMWRAFAAGGSTIVACGNMVPSLVDELARAGIPLQGEIACVEEEIGVRPIDSGLLSSGARTLASAAAELGHTFSAMPKAIDPRKCRGCGHCTLGCANGAKWTAARFVDEAVAAGAHTAFGVRVEKVLLDERGAARGVRARGPDGSVDLSAEVVILAAGGLGTPPILLNSGVAEAGAGLFLDLFVNTYGVIPGAGDAGRGRQAPNLRHEPSMALVDTEHRVADGFILSPYINQPRRVRFIEAGLRGFSLPGERTLGIMTKISDEATGRVFADGSVSKVVTAQDRRRLDRGAALSREILIGAGARPESIVVTRPQGAHPGGGAGIGRVVDAELRTRLDGLYVCDASVLPEAPGLPPILTLLALGRWLGNRLAA